MRVSGRAAGAGAWDSHAPGGALLRLPVEEERWAETVPPVPRGFDVTVSFSSPDLLAQHADALTLLGYRVVGVAPAGTPSAVLLVGQELVDSHQRYWRSLRSRADAAYSLALGPVLSLLEDTLRLHWAAPG